LYVALPSVISIQESLHARVLGFVEPECDLGSPDKNGPSYQIGILQHQIDRFLLGLRQRALLENRAPRADEIEEPLRVDVGFQERPTRRRLVDVDLFDLDAVLVQETPGVLARGSRRLGIERGLCHADHIEIVR
jgi:hypothetical protein